MLGLPDAVTTCLFDLDGVLTDTASVHDQAWTAMFDDFLRTWSDAHSVPFTAFDPHHDYDAFVDGKPRLDGVRDFLASRDIHLPEGTADDAATAQTVNGLGRRKNELLLERIERDGVDVFEGSRRYLEAAAAAGLHRAVVSSSANTAQVLRVTGLAALVELQVDGVTIGRDHLRGKPAPDTFLSAAERLGSTPAQCSVFEDALAGVAAGRAGDFGYVVGVDRVGQADELREHGADVVVQDLAELLDAP